MRTNFKTVDSYIKAFPANVQPVLQALRKTIREAAPDAKEGIAYGIPAYKSDGKPLVYFGAFKNHVGFYAVPSGHLRFADELAQYKQGKGSVQFPYDDVPYDLIRKIVLFRVGENRENRESLESA